ncbi:hypothetical protein [Paenibacillus koleovorans]|uniref:hypothetical protein n=1 Tax=Paenibacillus koleovorans TaxID=121608 RepID=UPI000FDBC53A|nr:hypothetical protein [Paenibacillus koleovorans]
MEAVSAIQALEDEIIHYLRDKFGWRIYSVEANHLGYGNMKWIMKTDNLFDPFNLLGIRSSSEYMRCIARKRQRDALLMR